MNDEFLKKDITVRILSVVFAILVWFYVITEQNPVMTKELTVPVRLVNQEYLQRNNIIMMEDPSSFKITLKLKGKNNVLNKINETTVSAVADLSGYSTKGENYVNVNITGIPEGVNLLSKTPNSLKLMLESKINVQMPVQVNVMGNPSQGLAAMSPVSVPADVLLSGAESQISRIKTVRVDVDIASVNAEVKKILPVRLLDENGKDITSVNIEPSTVEISIPIENTKRVAIEPVMTGQPASGYITTKTSVFPTEILVSGKQEVLETISSVKTEKIDLTDRSTGIDGEINLILPKGVELVNKNEKAKINIVIEPLVTKQIKIEKIDYVNLDGSLQVESLQGDIQMVLTGPESLINEAPANLKALVDLSGIGEGTHTLDVQLDIPVELGIVDVSSRQAVVIIKKL